MTEPVWPQRWNDYLAAFTAPVLDDQARLAELLAFAVARTSDEMPAGVHFGGEATDNNISVDVHPGWDALDPLTLQSARKMPKAAG